MNITRLRGSASFEHRRTVKQHYNEHLELEGVVYTMYDSRLRLNQQVIDEVNKYFPNKAYKTMIPRSVKLAEAPSFGKPVIYYENTVKRLLHTNALQMRS